MSQVSYGTITIVDTNDIESITIEYARNQSTSNPPDKNSDGWSTTRPSWEEGYYIWQRARIHKSGTDSSADTFGAAVCLTGSTGQIGETGPAGQSLIATKTQYTNVANNIIITTDNHTSYTWTDDVPEYNVNKPVYWGRITNTYSNPAKTEYLIYKDNGLTDAIAKSVEANTKSTQALSQSTSAQETVVQINNLLGGHFSSGSALTQLTPGGAWIIEQVKEGGVDLWSVPSKWHHNVTIGSNGINLRYNEAVMAQLAANQNNNTALTFYQPPIINEGTTTQGKKTLELSNSALIFYNPSDGITPAATLNASGLKIVDGSISLGTTGSDRVHLSTKDLSSAIEINGQSTTEWRLLLGDKFGVTKAGYMNAGSGKIGGLVLEQNSIHSNEKNLNNDIAGLYMDSSGQFNIGTRNRHVKFWNEDVSIESDTISLANITLDKETFLNRINYQSNTYSFIYYNSKWELDLNEVLLADYGISINGVTLKNNDAIRITYKPNNWKIDIQANKLSFSSGINVEEELITTQNISKVISGYSEINYEINESSNIKKVNIDEELFISKVGNYGTYDFIFRNNSWTLFNIIKSSSIIQLENIILDRDAFIAKVGSDNADYLFTYHNQEWILNEQAIDLKEYGLDVKPVGDGEDLSEGDNFTISCSNDIVNLSQYGMTYDSTQLPVNDDVIKVFYSQIEGLEGQITNIQEITQSAIDNANKAELAADNAIEIASELSGETIGSENIIIKTIGIPLDNVSLDKSTFLNKIERQQNVYNFIFSDGNWDLTKEEDNNPTPAQNDLVVLEQYGITISGDYTLQENDSIEITYEGFMPFSQLNNSISNLDDKLNQAILDSVERSTTKSDELANSIEQLRSDFENEKQEREARITFGLDGASPIMTLAGGKENPDLSITITNSELDFLDKGDIVAFISGQLLNINNAKVISNLQFGDFAFIPRENGNFCLKYLGTENA